MKNTANAWWKPLDKLLGNTDQIQKGSLDAARYLHGKLTNSGEAVRTAADALHGKQLGHPLHPLLTDITLGSWTLAFAFDLLGIVSGSARNAADKLTALGIIAAVPTGIAGMVDYSSIKRKAAAYGAAHGLMNMLAMSCYLFSAVERMRGNRFRAVFYAFWGISIVSASAWLGGDLAYRHRVGVNHAPGSDIDAWKTVMPVAELPEAEPLRRDVAGTPVLLFRRGQEIMATGAVCSHAGGPLEEGRVVQGDCIECPWHQSVFDVHSGQVVHSPAVYNLPNYETRIVDGQIEIRQKA